MLTEGESRPLKAGFECMTSVPETDGKACVEFLPGDMMKHLSNKQQTKTVMRLPFNEEFLIREPNEALWGVCVFVFVLGCL